MPQYKYLGRNKENKKVKGIIKAKSQNEAYKLLSDEAIIAYKITEVEDAKRKKYKLTSPQLSDFSRQVGTMLSSGVSIMKAVALMKDRETHKKAKEIYEELYSTINRGNTLAESMEMCEGSFPEMMINIFKAGEASGGLDHSAMKMADYYEREHKLNTKIKNAMTYPVVLMVVTIGVVIVVFTVILPQFFELFEGMDIPLVTKIMIGISHGLRNYGIYIAAVFVGIFVALAKILKTEKVKKKIDEQKLQMGKISKLMQIIYTARFSRTLSSLYTSGLVLLDAVNYSSKVTGNTFIESQFPAVVSKIRAGNSLSYAIDDLKGFDPKLAAVIYIGEETGKLDEMLSSIADTFDHDADAATTRLLTLIEPIMIIVMAVIIGSIMMSVMLPIFTMYNNIG